MTMLHRAAPLLAGLSHIAPKYDAILCDVWGVLHNGLTAHESAADALARFRAKGGVVVLISNAPRPGSFVLRMLDKMHVPHEVYDDIVTSGDVTRELLAAQPGAHVHHIGPERDFGVFDDLPVTLAAAGDAELVCCTGLEDDETETPEDYRERLETLAARGLPMICANPDLVVERGETLLYCAGAIADVYRDLGGQVTYAGKPHAPIYDVALQHAVRALDRPVARERTLAIGDALRTDMAGARDQGIDALFIARGIHGDDVMGDLGLDLEKVGELLAAEGLRPVGVQEKLVW